MHRLFLIALFALVGLLDPAWAQTQNMKTYGNCQTVTLPEPDGARYLVACSTDETIIGVAQALGTLTVMVGIGYQAHGGAQMSMTIRIDSGQTISRDALWDA